MVGCHRLLWASRRILSSYLWLATTVLDVLCLLELTSRWQLSARAGWAFTCFLPLGFALWEETREAWDSHFYAPVSWNICMTFPLLASLFVKKTGMKLYLQQIWANSSTQVFVLSWFDSNTKSLVLRMEMYSLYSTNILENLTKFEACGRHWGYHHEPRSLSWRNF